MKKKKRGQERRREKKRDERREMKEKKRQRRFKWMKTVVEIEYEIGRKDSLRSRKKE